MIGLLCGFLHTCEGSLSACLPLDRYHVQVEEGNVGRSATHAKFGSYADPAELYQGAQSQYTGAKARQASSHPAVQPGHTLPRAHSPADTALSPAQAQTPSFMTALPQGSAASRLSAANEQIAMVARPQSVPVVRSASVSPEAYAHLDLSKPLCLQHPELSMSRAPGTVQQQWQGHICNHCQHLPWDSKQHAQPPASADCTQSGVPQQMPQVSGPQHQHACTGMHLPVPHQGGITHQQHGFNYTPQLQNVELQQLNMRQWLLPTSGAQQRFNVDIQSAHFEHELPDRQLQSRAQQNRTDLLEPPVLPQQPWLVQQQQWQDMAQSTADAQSHGVFPRAHASHSDALPKRPQITHQIPSFLPHPHSSVHELLQGGPADPLAKIASGAAVHPCHQRSTHAVQQPLRGSVAELLPGQLMPASCCTAAAATMSPLQPRLLSPHNCSIHLQQQQWRQQHQQLHQQPQQQQQQQASPAWGCASSANHEQLPFRDSDSARQKARHLRAHPHDHCTEGQQDPPALLLRSANVSPADGATAAQCTDQSVLAHQPASSHPTMLLEPIPISIPAANTCGSVHPQQHQCPSTRYPLSVHELGPYPAQSRMPPHARAPAHPWPSHAAHTISHCTAPPPGAVAAQQPLEQLWCGQQQQSLPQLQVQQPSLRDHAMSPAPLQPQTSILHCAGVQQVPHATPLLQHTVTHPLLPFSSTTAARLPTDSPSQQQQQLPATPRLHSHQQSCQAQQLPPQQQLQVPCTVTQTGLQRPSYSNSVTFQHVGGASPGFMHGPQPTLAGVHCSLN